MVRSEGRSLIVLVGLLGLSKLTLFSLARSYTFDSDDDEDARVVMVEKKAKVGKVTSTSDFDAVNAGATKL